VVVAALRWVGGIGIGGVRGGGLQLGRQWGLQWGLR
jgi:hypothetical protein